MYAKIPCRYIEKLSVNFRGFFFVDLSMGLMKDFWNELKFQYKTNKRVAAKINLRLIGYTLVLGGIYIGFEVEDSRISLLGWIANLTGIVLIIIAMYINPKIE